MAQIYRMRAGASLEALADVRDFVTDAAVKLGLPQDAVEDLKVAVDEAVTNIVLHGYAGAEGDIEVAVEGRRGSVVLTLVDRAPAFDMDAVQGSDLNEPLNTRQIGGMGVHLMRTLTDSLSHEALPEGGNRITMVKKIPV